MLEVDLGPGIRAGFTTRHGGISPSPWESLNLGLGVGDDPARVRSNRARVADLVGVPVLFGTQVHGTHALTVSGPGEPSAGVGQGVPGAAGTGARLPPDSVGEADALVAAATGAVGVLVADCVPVLLADPTSRVVAAVHAGRRGLVHGVVGTALRAMALAGARLDRVRAVVGPCACGTCYEVPATMRDDVAAGRPTTRSTTTWGTAALDLPAGVEADLVSGGVQHVTRVRACTIEDDRFYSHRRATRGGLRSGRFAGVVALTD
ncbi:laccase domain-containing protein [Cellulosimicrobium arenosum]|uniref:Laccase domain-containing protein n=1 Tax=Cellulosimicrobium arenosum TaxID=2708133 RepID=A0A927GA81_9MICO|nr:polyphenol oxidase family protein [Cellulosimicrobium arenosum]MBD8079189.1 laccase domain-containing protein [Cellulosimicrobium arenosum]